MVKCVSKKKRKSKNLFEINENGQKVLLKNSSKKKKDGKGKKLSRSQIIKKLDIVFSRYIRLRDSDSKGRVVCPLCGAKMYWKQAQNMHFISRGCYKFRWDEQNCHAGCYRCNVLLKGNYIAYTRFMQNTYGIDKVDLMIQQSKKVEKISTFGLEEDINYYLQLGDALEKTKDY